MQATISSAISALPIDPGLGQLSDNGGPTPTHRPLSGSLVIDAGAAFSTTDFDQRDFGFDRLVNGATDIGALELQTNYDVIDFSGDGQIDGNDIDLLINNIATGPADPAIFDLNGDGQVNLADRDVWLALAGAANLPSGNPYLVSDANLDEVVDISDFNYMERKQIYGRRRLDPRRFQCRRRDGCILFQICGIHSSFRRQTLQNCAVRR